MINTKFNEEEKMIIENEMKFCVNNKNDFKKIYSYLESKYIIQPYKNAYLCDYYYDTKELNLLKNDITYRIRFRPQLSINLKSDKEITGCLWSRHEYSCKIKGKKSLDEIRDIDCHINRFLKKYLDIQTPRELQTIAKISTFRIGFNIFFPDKDKFSNYKYLGLCFFDIVYNKNEIIFYEFEMEAYQQRDSYVSPKIFKEFERIGKKIEELGYIVSTRSKLENFIYCSESKQCLTKLKNF